MLNTFDKLRDVNKYLNIFDIEALWSPFVTKGNLKKTLIVDILLRDVKNIKIALTVTDVQRKSIVLWGAAGSLCHTVKRQRKCTFITELKMTEWKTVQREYEYGTARLPQV